MAEADEDKIVVAMAVLRKNADDSGYGSFITDKQIEKLAVDILLALKELESSRPI